MKSNIERFFSVNKVEAGRIALKEACTALRLSAIPESECKITRVELTGSFSQDAGHIGSDVDFIVHFEGTIDPERLYMALNVSDACFIASDGTEFRMDFIPSGMEEEDSNAA